MQPAIVVTITVAVAILFLWLQNGETGNVTNTYGFADLLKLAQNAGFTGQDAITAAAVAQAESAGNPNAYNPETAAGTPDGKGSYGLWQIYLNAHPEYEGVNLNDPQTNANAAFNVYSEAGSSFSPWTSYKNGRYAAFLPTGAQNA